MATPELDLQGLWETTLIEVALEGSNGCTLERLWKLVGLVGPGGGSGEEKEGGSGQEAAQDDPQEFVKGWLWRWAGNAIVVVMLDCSGVFRLGWVKCVLVCVVALQRP